MGDAGRFVDGDGGRREDKKEVFYVNILTGEEDGIEQDGGRKEEVQKRAVRAKDRPVQWRKRRKIRLEEV